MVSESTRWQREARLVGCTTGLLVGWLARWTCCSNFSLPSTISLPHLGTPLSHFRFLPLFLFLSVSSVLSCASLCFFFNLPPVGPFFNSFSSFRPSHSVPPLFPPGRRPSRVAEPKNVHVNYLQEQWPLGQLFGDSYFPRRND